MRKALATVDDGMAMRVVSRQNGIPSSTLRGQVYGTTLNRKRGRKGVLTEGKEDQLIDYLTSMQDLGYPLTLGQLQEKIGVLTQARVTPFRDGVLEHG